MLGSALSNRKAARVGFLGYFRTRNPDCCSMRACSVLRLAAQSGPTLRPMDCSPPGSSVRRDSPGKNTGVGCHALLQGIFPTEGSSRVSRIAGGLFTS